MKLLVLFRLFLTLQLIAMIFMSCEKKSDPALASIRGNVTMNNKPAGIAIIRLFKVSENVLEASTLTGTNGDFHLSNISRGDYELWGGKNDSVPYGVDTIVQVNTSTEEVIIDLTLFKHREIRHPPSSGGSCPYIYSFDGMDYKFEGDIYAGAIYPYLERDDYLQLSNIRRLNGRYQVKISNELHEIQHTNLTELKIVNHPKDVQVLFDKYGKAHTLTRIEKPIKAKASNNADVLLSVSSNDNQPYTFNTTTEENFFESILGEIIPGDKGMSSVSLKFDKPTKAKNGKLVVKAKNSEWLVKMHTELIGFFGRHYNDWREYQRSDPYEDIYKNHLDQALPIMVYIETKEGWEYLDHFDMVGNMKDKEMIMPIDLSAIDSEILNIKLKTGFMFWELDYVGIDFSDNVVIDVQNIALSGIENVASDISTQSLMFDDNSYLKHGNGDMAILTFYSPEINSNQTNTVFFHSKGYYEQLFENDNDPEYLSLLYFALPGSLAAYSKDRHDEVVNSNKLMVFNGYGD